MTAARYPHQSMVFWVIVGVITVLCGIVVFFGSNSGWFTVHQTIPLHWGATIRAPAAPLFSISPTILSPFLVIVGGTIAVSALFILEEPEEPRQIKYCPFCKRRL